MAELEEPPTQRENSLCSEAFHTNPDTEQLEQVGFDLVVSTRPEEEPDIPHLPTTDRPDTGLQGTMSTSALNVVWSFGVNHHVPVLNLTDGHRNAVMYACAQQAIMYDYDNNKQYILQGHVNNITCSCLSEDKRWLITGDKGPDATIIAWDTYTGIPIQTLYDPNPQGGFVALALNYNGRYLATLSTAGPNQILAVWDWTIDSKLPLVSVDLDTDCGLQHHLSFSAQNDHFLVCTGANQVVFTHWDEKNIEYFAPPLTDSGFYKPVGNYTQSLYQNDTTRTLSATTYGYIIVWDNSSELAKEMCFSQAADKQAIKIPKVDHRAVDIITLWNQFVVVGDQGGQVTVLDQDLTLIHWYKIGLGTIIAVSFALDPAAPLVTQKTSSVTQRRDSEKKSSADLIPAFVVGDFVVGTAESHIATVTHNGKHIKIIQQEHDSAVHAMAVHPSQPYIVIGSYSNLLKVWNYETKEVLMSRSFEQNSSFHTCAYDPKGIYIVVGQMNGAIRVLDALTLYGETEQMVQVARSPITRVAFSPDSCFMATSDADYTTSLFRAQAGGNAGPYQFVGRYKAHVKPICGLTFSLPDENDKQRLFSLGADRFLVEYDLEKSTKNNLVVCSWDRIEQSAVPCCFTWYPPALTVENFIITANDQYKLKIYNVVTKICRKTLLGPTFGSPLKTLVVVPNQGGDGRCYGAYATEDKVGLIIFPVDGNPHKSMALIAHPFGVSRLEVSHDGRYLFTAGGTDTTVHMWEINTAALEAQAKLGGEGLIPFYDLLDGAREGQFFSELEDYFYYAQLRSQGLNTFERREVSTTVPLSQLPSLLRALHYYPTEQEIEEMMNEVKFSRYVETGKYIQEVDLGTVIQLFVNHRPAFGYSFDKIKWAFDTLGVSSPAGGILPSGQLLDLLQSRGEHMTEYELAECLATLLGLQPEGGSNKGHDFDPVKAASLIDQQLPPQISAPVFIQDILGLNLSPNPPPPATATAAEEVCVVEDKAEKQQLEA